MTTATMSIMLPKNAGEAAFLLLGAPVTMTERAPSRSFVKGVVAGMIVMHPEKWAQVKTKPAQIGWFIGRTMQACDGNTNSAFIEKLFKEPSSARTTRRR